LNHASAEGLVLKTIETYHQAHVRPLLCAVAIAAGVYAGTASAQTAPDPSPYGKLAPVASSTPDPYHELETKYLFGFTEGADIGAEGEQSIEYETTTSSGKRGFGYNVLEQEVEYENVPTQNFGYELSAHGLAYSIHNTEGLDDAQGANFSGLSAELRYLVIGRGPGSPYGLTLVAEPEWARIDDGGQPVTDFSTTFRGIVDTELIPNRLYGAVNLLYTPDIAKSPGEAWEQSSEFGATAALAYRVAPKVTVGGEVEYYSAFDGLAFKEFAGESLYVGPTLQIQFTGKIMMSAAFSTQIAGHAAGDSRPLDLTNFSRNHGNLKLEFEF
jgi:hypothetical protein